MQEVVPTPGIGELSDLMAMSELKQSRQVEGKGGEMEGKLSARCTHTKRRPPELHAISIAVAILVGEFSWLSVESAFQHKKRMGPMQCFYVYVFRADGGFGTLCPTSK
jgi:hypothetical protein